MPLERPPTTFTKIIFSDASSTGCGAFIKNCEGTSLVHYWQKTEKNNSSTWRELKAVEIYLKEKISLLAGLSIKWYTDNQAVPRIIHKGSMVENLQISALEIFKMCLENNITLSIDWIPRDKNEEADELSKHKNIDDWSVQDHIFKFLNAVVGPFTCDCFASNISAKVSKFYAKFCCAGVAGVDAFAFDWSKDLVWLVPPPALIIKTVFHCKLCKAKGVLIAPKWETAMFWPILKHSDGWAPGIHLLYEYQNPKNFFNRGPFGNSVFTEARFASNVVVLGLNFSV
jgi:hypothetical protein